MSIITDDIEGHFRAARAAAPKSLREALAQTELMQRMGIVDSGGRVYQNGPVVVANRDMPSVGIGHRVANNGSVGYRKVANGLDGNNLGANVSQTAPEIRNPLLSLINFYLPYDRKTLNQWIRYYARTDPYVGNCLDLNGQFPISDFHFSGTSDPNIIRAFEEMKERSGMLRHAFECSREEEEIGECFTFWQWDDDEACWVDYTIMNPDRLEVKELNWGSGMNAFYSLDPPEPLKTIVRSTDPHVQEALSQLDPAVLEALSSNARVPLDPFNVMALVRKASPYDERGTSPVMRCLKALLYKDKLIEAQYAIADQQITPVQLWKLGDPANGYMPTEQHLQDFRNLLQAGRHDPLFTIVSHAAVNLELIGYTGKLLPILPELEWVAKQVMIALYTNEATIQGSGPSYGAAIVPFKILQGRYQVKRDKIAELYRRKLLKPFSEAHEIFTTPPATYNGRIRGTKTRVPLVPKFEWNFKLDLTDSAQKLQFAMQLKEKMSLPMRTICELLNLDYESTKKSLKDEEGSVFDQVYQAARQKRGEANAVAGPGAPGVPGGGGGDEGGGAPPAGGAPAAAEPPAGAEAGAEGGA